MRFKEGRKTSPFRFCALLRVRYSDPNKRPIRASSTEKVRCPPSPESTATRSTTVQDTTAASLLPPARPSRSSADYGQSQCRACALAATRTRLVLPSGRRDAPLFVLEETPTPLQKDTARRSTPRLSACKPFSAFLSERGIAEGTYSHGYCCACDTPNNRRPTRSEVASCSRWLA